MTRAEETCNRLKAEGWEFDHEATCRDYKSAGSISYMKDKNGYEYCRVHHGKSCGRRKEYQITSVMRRKKEVE